ncbi:MAG: adenine phosphoribosyltransferase [Spirochaetia bacterium]
MNLEKLDKTIRRVPDFPSKGILFYDITAMLAHPGAFRFVIDEMVRLYKDKNLGAVAGVEARGFLIAAPFAYEMGIPLIPVRKAGKLPGVTLKASYQLEYGRAEVEVHQSDIPVDKNVLLVDDLIATGGTLAASADLLERGGAHVKEVFGVVGLTSLNYQKVLDKYSVTTLLNYKG